MIFHLKTDGEPAYMQIYQTLRNAITDGELGYHEKLGSKRNLALELRVSVITVAHAMDLLIEEGYVEARPRSGYFVSYQKEEQFPVGNPVLRPDLKGPGAVTDRYEAGVDSFSYPMLARTVRRVLSKYGERILEKSPNQGSRELRRSLAEYLARSRGIYVQPEQIVVGAGSEYLYSLIIQMLGRERLYALEDPSYEKIRMVYEANGAACEMLPLGTHGIHTEALQHSHASVLHVTPFNSYPSGVTASASRRRSYIRWAEERDGMIIEDDYASEFSPSTKAEDTLFSLSPKKRVIYLNTFTKTISPSVRIGYMVLPEDKLQRFTDKIGFYSCTVPMFDQYVLAEFLDSGEFERHINRIRRKMRRTAAPVRGE